MACRGKLLIGPPSMPSPARVLRCLDRRPSLVARTRAPSLDRRPSLAPRLGFLVPWLG